MGHLRERCQLHREALPRLGREFTERVNLRQAAHFPGGKDPLDSLRAGSPRLDPKIVTAAQAEKARAALLHAELLCVEDGSRDATGLLRSCLCP